MTQWSTHSVLWFVCDSDKLDDLELLFLNMHNLINAFRPHQARETIIEMLKAQIQERREAALDIRRCGSVSGRSIVLVTLVATDPLVGVDTPSALSMLHRTIDESRKAVELVHADLHEAPEDAARTDASDVKMEDVELSGDASARQHALENGFLSPTGTHAGQSAVREGSGGWWRWVGSQHCDYSLTRVGRCCVCLAACSGDASDAGRLLQRS